MLQNEVRDTPQGESVYNFEGKKTEKKQDVVNSIMLSQVFAHALYDVLAPDSMIRSNYCIF